MINGDVVMLQKALGAREGEALLQEVLDFVGDDYETEVFDDGDKYIVAVGRGVDFLLRDGVVTTVFVHAIDSDEQRAYPR